MSPLQNASGNRINGWIYPAQDPVSVEHYSGLCSGIGTAEIKSFSAVGGYRAGFPCSALHLLLYIAVSTDEKVDCILLADVAPTSRDAR